MQSIPHSPHWRYLSTQIRERQWDGILSLNVVLTYAELDMVHPDDALEAVQDHKPWKNPLIWVTVATAKPSGRQKLVQIQQAIIRTGSMSEVLDIYPEMQSLIE